MQYIFQKNIDKIYNDNNNKGSNKSCVVSFTKTERKKKYSDVALTLTGEDWAENELNLFQSSFWNQFNDLEDLV